MALGQAGFEIVGEAATGEETLELLDTTTTDLVITDINKPGGIDGIETTRRIRTRDADLPVIVFSASPEDDVIEEVRAAGASLYISKDAPLAELDAAIRDIVGSQRA